jgi:hypothetical protein
MSVPQSSLDRLADVELQLVMQALEFSSLLTFARASRRARHLAQAAVVWKFALPVPFQLNVPTLEPRENGPRTTTEWRANPLLRHVWVALTLKSGYAQGRFWHIKMEPGWMQRLPPKIYSLNMGGMELLAPSMHWLLMHPAMRHLHSLVIDANSDCNTLATMQLVSSLPHLHTLAVRSNGWSEAAIAQLHQSASLRNLSVYMNMNEWPTLLEGFTQVKRVRIDALAITGSDYAFVELFRYMSHVEHLTLHGFTSHMSKDNERVALLPGACSTLTSVHTLHLMQTRFCNSLEYLLPYLAYIPQLRVLHITLAQMASGEYRVDNRMILQLLHDSPQLHITMHVTSRLYNDFKWSSLHPRLHNVVDGDDGKESPESWRARMLQQLQSST